MSSPAPWMEPLLASDDAFRLAIGWFETGLEDGFASLDVDPRSGYMTARLYGNAAGISDEDKDLVRSVLQYVDQLFVFAFEDAPDHVIKEWAAEIEQPESSVTTEALQKKAVERVHYLRENALASRREWNLKTDSVVPMITPMRYQAVTGPSGGLVVDVDFTAVRSMIGFETNPTTVVARMTVPDARRMVYTLSQVLEELDADDDS